MGSDTREGKRPYLCLIASAGGHFTELLCLQELWEKYPRFWVTSSFDSLPGPPDPGVRRCRLIDPQRNVLKFIVNALQAFRIFRRERPDAVVTTGSGIAIPFCLWAKAHGKKVIFIESAAAVKELSLCGKIMYHVADLFIVQWKSLMEDRPRAVFGGSLL